MGDRADGFIRHKSSMVEDFLKLCRVFVAQELELGRRVVVKVLPPEMAAGVNADRFRLLQLEERRNFAPYRKYFLFYYGGADKCVGVAEANLLQPNK